MTNLRRASVVLIVLLSIGGCGDDGGASDAMADTGGSDTSVVDTGAVDADTGAADTSVADAGSPVPPMAGECAPDTWPPEAEAFEAEFVRLKNERRAGGGFCRGVDFPSLPAVTINPVGSGVARLYAAYIAAGGSMDDPDANFWANHFLACAGGSPKGLAFGSTNDPGGAAAQFAKFDCSFSLYDGLETVSIGHVAGPLPTTVIYLR